MSDQPLPCPFCGSESLFVMEGGRQTTTCRRCIASGPYKGSPETSLVAWNTRPTETALRARIAELEKRNAEDIEWGQRHKDQSIQIAIESGQRLKLIQSLEAERDTLKARVEQESKDWAEDHTALQKLAAPIIGEAKAMGDSFGVPGIRDLAEMCVEALKARVAELAEELEQEQGRWQESIYDLLCSSCGDAYIDGSGCDSGDPLDLTLTEIGQALGLIKAERDLLREDKARLDWLDSVNANTNQHYGTTYGWKFDINCNRASLSDHNLPAKSVREAIDEARQAIGKEGVE